MDTEKLRDLMHLKYEKTRASLTDILRREAEVRAELSKLDAQAYEARALPADRPSMQNIGADVIWLKWVAGAKKALNMQLAQVLAQKEAQLARQRRALGQKTVAQELDNAAQRVRSDRRTRSELEKVIELATLFPPRT